MQEEILESFPGIRKMLNPYSGLRMLKIQISFIAVIYLMLAFSPSVFSQYQIRHFNTENGMPSNGIKGLQWDDASGFLWIATEAGLVRYNGMNFKIFDNTSNPEFGSNRIITLLKNVSGKILVGGDEGNLSLIKENKVSVSFSGSKIAKYNYNHYCALTTSDTLFRQCFKTPWPGNFWISRTTVIPFNDTMCIAENKGKLYCYSISRKAPEQILPTVTNIKNAFKIGRIIYYIDSLNRVFTVDINQNAAFRQKIYESNGSPLLITQKNSKLFWQPGMDFPVLIQDGNVWAIEKQKNQLLQCSLIASGIPKNTLFTFAQYAKNRNLLFLGTNSKGIYIIEKNKLQTRHPAETNINQLNAFYSQIELPNGNIITNQGIIIGDNPSNNDFNIGSFFLNRVFSLNDSLLIFCRKDSMFLYNKY